MKRQWVPAIAIVLLAISCQQQGNMKQEKENPGTSEGQENESNQAVPSSNDKTFQVDPTQEIGPGKEAEVDQEKTLFLRGTKMLKDENFQEGIDYFTRVIDLNPNNYKAYYNRGFGYYYLKDYDKAQKDFEKALELKPDDPDTHNYLGLVYYFREDYRKSVEEYSLAIQSNPQFATAYYNRGIARGQLKDYKGAIADFDLAIQYRSDYPDAYFNRGLARFLKGDRKKACEDWEQAKSLGSFNANEAINLYCGSSSN